MRRYAVCKFDKTEILKECDTYFPDIIRHEDIAFVGRAKKYFYLM